MISCNLRPSPRSLKGGVAGAGSSRAWSSGWSSAERVGRGKVVRARVMRKARRVGGIETEGLEEQGDVAEECWQGRRVAQVVNESGAGSLYMMWAERAQGVLVSCLSASLSHGWRGMLRRRRAIGLVLVCKIVIILTWTHWSIVCEAATGTGLHWYGSSKHIKCKLSAGLKYLPQQLNS